MGQLKQWREQNWVRIGTDGAIKGNVVQARIKKTQIAVYLLQKQEVYLNQKGLQLQEKRKKQELKAKL